MKKYEVYRNIRKQAMIMGLSLSLFALQMVSVIGSLLIIIFSFSLGVIVALLLFNALLFGALAQWVKNPHILAIQKVFPRTISNKRLSSFSYA
ncbi:MAG: hypothetical protein DSY83_12720 [Flavobacteriia bacterium]|uniref:Uncharacterized protein n=1 Tax=Flagellimonas abyssi TaxID=2864871 RepID=A0ABS7EV51_9FLAO|nr:MULTISPECIES: hypothetical protein [Allomuricauda]MAU14085.1 hypothetical protein [Allomuricauda sp.]MBW8201220.1 hypothetical protein [Allomuricauda abyssi]RUA13002.1 MAG: hypothetical protein DSY83_12720 [Flavobacteriia bacterium]